MKDTHHSSLSGVTWGDNKSLMDRLGIKDTREFMEKYYDFLVDLEKLTEEKLYGYYFKDGYLIIITESSVKKFIFNENSTYKLDIISDGVFYNFTKHKPKSEFTNKATLTPGIEIGDEFMWHGGERRVKGFDDIGNVELVDVDKNGNIEDKGLKVSIESFLKEASKFPTVLDKVELKGIQNEQSEDRKLKKIKNRINRLNVSQLPLNKEEDKGVLLDGLKVLLSLEKDPKKKKEIKAEIKKLS